MEESQDAPGPSGQEAGPSGQAQGGPGGQAEEEVVDIDLNDPEVADAAAKIQLGFKKHMMKKKK